MALVLTIETELEEDGRRWIAEVEELPGVIVYGDSETAAVAQAQALALRVVADKIEHGEMPPEPALALSFRAVA
jgi:predicted RNase H-like HicB family nuclease